MKKIYTLIASCAVVCILSCQKNNESAVTEEPKVEVATEPHIVTLSVPYPALETQTATKVFMDPADGKSYWEVGDKIVIYGKPSGDIPSTNYIVHAITASEITNPAIAVITEDISAIEAYAETGSIPHKYNAAYPAEDWYFYSHWTGNGRASFNNTNQILMAGYVSDELDAINLFNLNAVIAFKVSGDFDSYNFMGNNGDEIVGYTHYLVEMNVASPDYRLKHNTDMTWGTFGDQYSISGPVNGDGETYNFVYIPYKAELPNGFTIEFLKNGVVKQYVTSKVTSEEEGLTIDHGHFVDLGLIPAVAMHAYSPISASEKAAAEDKSENESANCYVVNAGDSSNESKVFKFRAVKGNSYVKGVSAGTSVGSVDHVSVLWETWNTTSVTSKSVIKAVDYADDFVYFKMPEALHDGNAVIAAFDNENAILWSWHIWVPASAVGSGTYGFEKTFMDRNLGALVTAGTGDVRANGLMYQWGRKDPFVTRGVQGSSTVATVSGTSMSVSAKELTYDEARQNPTKFSIAASGSKYHWIDPYDNTLWGASKTVNDPCPPGWRIPHRDETALFTTDYSSSYSYDSENGCITIGTLVLPCNGRIYYTTGALSDRGNAYIWSSKCSDNGLARWLRGTDSACKYADERAACAEGVRCISAE